MADQAQSNTSDHAGQDSTGANSDVLTGDNQSTDTGNNNSGDSTGVLSGASGDNASDKDSGQSSGDKGSVADAEIKVTLPEGIEIDKELLDGYTGLAKEIGLDSDKASKMATWYAQKQVEIDKARMAEYEAVDKAWIDEIKADPDVGGKNFAASVAVMRSAVNQFGGEQLRAELDRLGISNNPILARAFYRIGKALGEDTTHSSKVRSGANKGASSYEEKLAKRYNKSQDNSS